MFRKLGKLEADSLRYFLGKIVAGGAGFLIIPILIRGMGVENYGQYSFWVFVVRWVVSVTVGWLQQSVLRYHAEYELSGSFSDYIRTVRLIDLVLSLSTGLILFVLGLASRLGVLEAATLGILTVLWFLYTHYMAVLRAELKSTSVILGDSLSNLLLTLVCVVALLFGGFSLLFGFVATAGAYFLGSAIFFRASSSPKTVSGKWSRPIFRQLFTYGLPMGVWFTLTNGQVLIGRFALQVAQLHEGLGIYNAFSDFFTRVGTLFFVPGIYALHSLIMRSWALGQIDDVRSSIRRTYFYQIGLGVVLFIGTIVAYPLIVRFLFGTPPADLDYRLLFIILIGVFFNNLSLISHKGLEVTNQTALMAKLMVLATMLNTAISLTLTSVIGPLAPAIGFALGNIVYFVATVFYSNRELRLTSERAVESA